MDNQNPLFDLEFTPAYKAYISSRLEFDFNKPIACGEEYKGTDAYLLKSYIEQESSMSTEEMDSDGEILYILNSATFNTFEEFAGEFFGLQLAGNEPYIDVSDSDTCYMSVIPEDDFQV